MLTIRRSTERGHIDHGWLDTKHTFSFGNYHDEEHMGFGPLRVINEDIVAAGQGFGKHPHRDMEILTYVIRGSLEHKDSLGTGSVIQHQTVQRMTAGRGVLHSEFNPSETDATHLLQIWIEPERLGLPPGYEEKTFPIEDRAGELVLIGSRDARDGSLTIHQDVDLYAGIFSTGISVEHHTAGARKLWLQVISGVFEANDLRVEAGDGLQITDTALVTLRSVEGGEILLFDMK